MCENRIELLNEEADEDDEGNDDDEQHASERLQDDELVVMHRDYDEFLIGGKFGIVCSVQTRCRMVLRGSASQQAAKRSAYVRTAIVSARTDRHCIQWVAWRQETGERNYRQRWRSVQLGDRRRDGLGQDQLSSVRKSPLPDNL